MTPTADANQQQAAHWNAAAGRTWTEMQAVLDALFAPVAEAVIAEAFPGPGGRVLDVGCGAGATTLDMAGRLGASGRCLGVDISQILVETSERNRRAAGVASAEFAAGDAQTFPFETGAFDAAMSRFGVMFFEDPVAAFGNIRRALRPGGKLAFAAWRSPEENPFMAAAAGAVAGLLPALPKPEPDAPGQFGFAREARMRAILEAAGWSRVEIRPLDVGVSLSEADLFDYVTRMGPVGQAIQDLAEAERQPVIEAVLAAFQPFVRDGRAVFDLACWRVTARA